MTARLQHQDTALASVPSALEAVIVRIPVFVFALMFLLLAGCQEAADPPSLEPLEPFAVTKTEGGPKPWSVIYEVEVPKGFIVTFECQGWAYNENEVDGSDDENDVIEASADCLHLEAGQGVMITTTRERDGVSVTQFEPGEVQEYIHDFPFAGAWVYNYVDYDTSEQVQGLVNITTKGPGTSGLDPTTNSSITLIDDKTSDIYRWARVVVNEETILVGEIGRCISGFEASICSASD